MNAREQLFRRRVFAYARKEGRANLPWRKTTDPYRILVSEIMLQQTRVERVIPYYENWIRRFPTVQKLAKAPLAEVLKAWQGLGYNRRGKNLHLAAQLIVSVHKGKVPTDAKTLETLPGIGPYTARAVLAFAYNADVIFIETNIRTVVTHHFFQDKKIVDDMAILEILTSVFPKGKSREWYAALMDYGAHLKRSGIKLNAKAKGYTPQSKFQGSAREARGAILKKLMADDMSLTALSAVLGKERVSQVKTQIQKLLAEGMIEKRGRLFSLPR